jgi:hypothetical protein
MVATAILDAAFGFASSLPTSANGRLSTAHWKWRLGNFRSKHAELVASLFDERFVKDVAAPELAKLLTPRRDPDIQRIVEAFAKQFGKATPDVTHAVNRRVKAQR